MKRPKVLGMDLDIVKRGANAYCLGHSESDNPYFQEKNMPKNTGESMEEWNKKADAWEYGWNMERASRL